MDQLENTLEKDSFQSFERIIPSSLDTVELANTIEAVKDNKVYDETAEKESIFLFKD